MHNITFTENNIKQKHLDIVSPKKFFKSKKKNCEICNSSKLEIFQKIGRIGSPLEYGKLIIVICKKCGHKFINPIYEDQFYKFYYNKISCILNHIANFYQQLSFQLVLQLNYQINFLCNL